MRGFGDNDYVALDEEAQGDLRHGFIIFLSDSRQYPVREKVIDM